MTSAHDRRQFLLQVLLLAIAGRAAAEPAAVQGVAHAAAGASAVQPAAASAPLLPETAVSDARALPQRLRYGAGYESRFGSRAAGVVTTPGPGPGAGKGQPAGGHGRGRGR